MSEPLYRRWYVAFHPAAPVGVIRSKDAEGIAEWRSRSWQLFPSPPTIVDVTDQMGAIFATVGAGDFSPDTVSNGRLDLVFIRDREEVALVPREQADEAPRPGELVDLSDAFLEVLRDIRRSTPAEGSERKERQRRIQDERNRRALEERYRNQAEEARRDAERRQQSPFNHPPGRFFRWIDRERERAEMPEPGGPVDGVAIRRGDWLELDRPVHVHIATTVRMGQDLATDAEGRAVPAGPGDVVIARARHDAGPPYLGAWADPV